MRQLVAIIDETKKINFNDLKDVAAAIQIQVSTDVKPIWDVDAEVVAYQRESDIPYHAWKVYIKDKLDIDVYGYHYVDDNGKPYAVLKYRDDWTLTLSHEIVEMLCDPYGDRLMSSENFFCCQDCADGKGECESILPAEVNGVKEVLVEVSDPSQSANFGYYVTVGSRKVLLSDFYYRTYFTDVRAVAGHKYSHTGAITRPKQILEGGYISFKNRSGEWWQAFKVGGKLIFKKITNKKEVLSNNDIITLLSVAISGIGVVLLTMVLKAIFGKKKHENSYQNIQKNYPSFA